MLPTTATFSNDERLLFALVQNRIGSRSQMFLIKIVLVGLVASRKVEKMNTFRYVTLPS